MADKFFALIGVLLCGLIFGYFIGKASATKQYETTIKNLQAMNHGLREELNKK